MEHSSCGVGFLTSLDRTRAHKNVQLGLKGLLNMEHRGGTDLDGRLGDGAGIMTDIPWKLFGIKPHSMAVATIFCPEDEQKRIKSLEVFEQTFGHFGLVVEKYREVPVNLDALVEKALENKPRIFQAFIKRPEHCRTMTSFDKMLYLAKQMTRVNQKEAGIVREFFFTSLSCRTIIYKALSTAKQFAEFYPDLNDPRYETSMAVFHRRFSTNTLSSWDKVQPFRQVAHNGEINTIEGNVSAAITREKSLGLRADELITHKGSSDSGNLNGMVEALKYRSSIPNLAEILAIMIPPAGSGDSNYFKFWSRAMEPWDGPALVAFSDGKRIGARLDRNGFRPCRWMRTENTFFLSSEAGCFEVPHQEITSQGALYAGRSVSIHILKGEINFSNPDKTSQYQKAQFDPRLKTLPYLEPKSHKPEFLEKRGLFYYTKEDLSKVLVPMIVDRKEPIGSMGDTSRLAPLSSVHRTIYDYFYQNFAQVTNPPLDYIREKMVTELKVYLGRKPNIFEPKELIPAPEALEAPSPILSLGQMEYIKQVKDYDPETNLKSETFDVLFDRDGGVEKFHQKIDEIVADVIQSVRDGSNIIVLSDRKATYDQLPIPAIIIMRAVQLHLNRAGLRLRISLIVDSGEVRDSHQVAVLIGFGASAVCPYLALETARYEDIPKVADLFPEEREKSLIKSLEYGLLRIMAKRGISVVRSYQGAELFTILGLGEDVLKKYFPAHKSLMGGLNFENLIEELKARSEETRENPLPNNFLYKEHASGKFGELHSMTSSRARTLHKSLKEEHGSEEGKKLFLEFMEATKNSAVNVRHLMDLAKNEISLEQVEPKENILKTFGCGAMSFGAISAESQRDLIKAFEAVGGRSNSGEGGENPFYFKDGTTASVKQIASGRFGVTAEYLVSGEEVQIKIAQGAKPGEGGQLMGVKVNADIAKARHATVGVDLISPPPQHDIYSIEDLKGLIYELKQLRPDLLVSVKLVSGKNIGAIALGVVKAGADIIQISGGDGGTGAASLMSMKHAGLPWEFGLLEAHRVLHENDLRKEVILRTDGGLQTGRDIVMAAILGGQQFDFGKMALIAQGCIMARICEKNTCPAGIATHDPKFKARYKGSPEDVVSYLNYLAEDVRSNLAAVGAKSLEEVSGRLDLLIPNKKYAGLMTAYNLKLDYFLGEKLPLIAAKTSTLKKANSLNEQIVGKFKESKNGNFKEEFVIKSTDRGIPATLSGHLALKSRQLRVENSDYENDPKVAEAIDITFKGSAGQGFGVFNFREVNLRLEGEANDSLAKGMQGGKIVVTTAKEARFDCSRNVLAGNACLYGATGGKLFLHGLAGDRFGVRNSGALAVCEGAGLHACEYMTGGKIVILGRALENIGAGMTGGELFLHGSNQRHINTDFIKRAPLVEKDKRFLEKTLKEYFEETGSKVAEKVLGNLEAQLEHIYKYVPVGQ